MSSKSYLRRLIKAEKEKYLEKLLIVGKESANSSEISEGVLKTLKNIISEEITRNYNIEGVHGKKSLKTMANFYSALLDSIPINENCSGSAETQLRKAIQLQKKRHFKKLANTRTE
ncbi:PREDICTED: uncharacterized protein LOC108359845 [Rhagoletis zephyria]|uniref:uncharacterized protein LOC108359845 n=1 Tax=Rhagoletis zephyria TaxID=28612 RepID=UPI00081123C8|nr:PREDICTED: uncharacterized protein LOC108359845 [Rhagoletis zephyria]